MDYFSDFIHDYYFNQIHLYFLHLFLNFKSLSFIYNNLLIKNLNILHHFDVIAFQFPQNHNFEALPKKNLFLTKSLSYF